MISLLTYLFLSHDLPVYRNYLAALDVGGRRARQVWGKQWHKLLANIYQAATAGINGDGTRMLGGSTPAGKAARVRVQLEIERIMGASSSSNWRIPAVQYHPRFPLPRPGETVLF
jgi:hypothetical protein